MSKIQIKTGDSVMVITGKDKGKKGKIISVDTKNARVFVDKVNLVKKHTKPTQAAPQGGIIKKEASIDASNVMIMCGKCGKPVRIKKQILEDGSRVRVCAKCGQKLD